MRKEELSIIVVDDLQFSREVVKSALTKAGFGDIRTASSAEEGMYLLNEKRAHVVLADFWMPGMNGLEMTDLIRRWDENNDRYTGIVLLTAEDTTTSIVVAFDRGVDDFVSKAANQFELAARVYGAGRSAYQQNELRSRTRSVSSQFMRVKQFCLQDPETSLPNRAQLEAHLQSLLDHCATRGGGLALGLIEVESQNSTLRLGTLKTIANSLQLAVRPMDLVSRFNVNTFAVSIFYTNPAAFNVDVYHRLVASIKRHTRTTSDEGKPLNISVGVWHAHSLDSPPSVNEVIASAQNSFELVQ